MTIHAVLDHADYLTSQKKECYIGKVSSEDLLIVSYTTVTSILCT